MTNSMLTSTSMSLPSPGRWRMDYHINGSWHVDYSGDADYVYKSALRKGDYRTMTSYTGDGDFIDVTPFELPICKNPDFEKMMCPADLDSCPDQPGLDPLTITCTTAKNH
ncbi:hypothetical protein PWT90_02497 [Aphanocladium album]|nr:hypothetical protein PWT90_02497 [Aphanocladium album]